MPESFQWLHKLWEKLFSFIFFYTLHKSKIIQKSSNKTLIQQAANERASEERLDKESEQQLENERKTMAKVFNLEFLCKVRKCWLYKFSHCWSVGEWKKAMEVNEKKNLCSELWFFSHSIKTLGSLSLSDPKQQPSIIAIVSSLLSWWWNMKIVKIRERFSPLKR